MNRHGRVEVAREIHLHRTHCESEVVSPEFSIFKSHVTDCNHTVEPHATIAKSEVTIDGEILLIPFELGLTRKNSGSRRVYRWE